MNMCIHGTIATGVETLRARVEHNMARGASEFCSAWKLTDAGNNEFIWLGNITDMDDEAKKYPIVTKVENDAKVNSVMSNSFGFGGTNATLVFEKV